MSSSGAGRCRGVGGASARARRPAHAGRARRRTHSSCVQGPLTRPGRSTFCQRCRHCTSVRREARCSSEIRRQFLACGRGGDGGRRGGERSEGARAAGVDAGRPASRPPSCASRGRSHAEQLDAAPQRHVLVLRPAPAVGGAYGGEHRLVVVVRVRILVVAAAAAAAASGCAAAAALVAATAAAATAATAAAGRHERRARHCGCRRGRGGGGRRGSRGKVHLE